MPSVPQSETEDPENRIRTRLRVTGTVQGVGFRPFVYGLATRLGLSGFVLNDAAGVLIEVEGDPGRVGSFRAELVNDPPPLAIVESVRSERVPSEGAASFEIRVSESHGQARTPVASDVAPCDECLTEIFGPGERRYRYPFTNCTNCGPRFTITTDVPYDRPNTTMASFPMCSDCAGEYGDPSDRRFHAQPIACPNCGPRMTLLDGEGSPVEGDPIVAADRLLADGAIVAIKGLGGYHLACSAADERAVVELRRRKGREEKPFALMARDLDSAMDLVEMTEAERGLLVSPRRPIVLAPRRADAPVAHSVAPGNGYLGVMLPYTPLHHLLMAERGAPIVLTSGNASDEPIAYRDDEALARLAVLADAFLVHDRDIHVRCDDSIVRVGRGRAFPVRRSRGFAPEPLSVSTPFERTVLAAGPELKHTFCLGVGDRAIVSHHVGDLENFEAMTAFTEGVEHFTRVFDAAAEVVAHDLHPEYLATKWAKAQPGVDLVGVQHHHAHIASCLADNDRTQRVIGLALDGTGFGEDGAIWGCEVLACDFEGYERLAHLAYVPIPGGAMAIREPWRMAAVYLDAALGEAASGLPLAFVERTRGRWGPILQMAARGINSPETSSAGRLFDAVAALCGLRERVSYEGQAAAELEQVTDGAVTDGYPCTVKDGAIEGVELFASVVDDLVSGSPTSTVAARFHNGLASALVAASEQAREATGLSCVALSGGAWQNVLLLERAASRLQAADFQVLTHRRVPPNDGGISLGQAVIANARCAGS